MIIGTITLITILLTGGTFNTMFIEKADKYASKVIMDKERAKEVKERVKASKQEIKAYSKERKGLIKELKEMNLDRSATGEDFDAISDKMINARQGLDALMVERRVEIQQMIEEDEWRQIIEMAVEETNSQKSKEEEKDAKGKLKNAFDKVDETIESTMTSGEAKDQVVIAAVRLREAFNKLENNAVDKYGSDNAIIVNQNSTAQELGGLMESVTEIRDESLGALEEFHFAIVAHTTEKEWEKIIKQVNKLLL